MAVILSSYGTPNTIEEVEKYVVRIYGKKRQEVVEELVQKIKTVGISPANKIIGELAKKLENKLGERVVIGNRNWDPMLVDALNQIKHEKEVKFVPLTPFSSAYVLKGYLDSLNKALKQVSVEGELKLVSGWYTFQPFHTIWSKRCEITPELSVVFTAHTLMKGDEYEKQVRTLAQEVARKLGIEEYHVAFHSQPMMPGDWIRPSIFEIVQKIKTKGVLVVPIGFVFTNMEVTFDLDYEFKEKLESLGLIYKRAPLPDADDDFVEVLSRVIKSEQFVTNM
ncbi:hypothetical protein B9Q00_07335 [Candidatus Marsarchaeota G1 archaeon OSP_C]|jgi:Protoheme ferro-lyase (ferrochelatase)|uniref:Ferrochelatase n=1 Tax=Candidatus Marsarchaeota G1 archaeon OSP_C TaxID=1978154 RepID=A0A2R6ANJ7_9ARCH|nr:MAG: hypothetical protein B9Q00_07335 [Candidatus Marsarchaeota G1 archaeon OSP_C]